MAEAGINKVETYVSRHQNAVMQYITTRPIMDLCLAEMQCSGAQVSKQWWDQEGIDLEGIQ